jgi:23S rRNA (guanosine2251-2'-O)-methyltransferase
MRERDGKGGRNKGGFRQGPGRDHGRDRDRPRGQRFGGKNFGGKGGSRHERGGRPHRTSGGGDGPVILFGWHSVTSALGNPARKVRKLLLTENAARRLTEEGFQIPAHEIVRPDEIARRLTPDSVHNGLLAEADPLDAPGIEDIEANGVVLVLDQITDPHNVGAILRSAAAFGVKALVTTARHSPEATGTLAKSASGALEFVPMVLVQNLARALAALKERGFLTVGLDSEATEDLNDVPMSAPLALVLGAEGKGLRQLTRETCDHLARLDLPGAIKSLNVSNAAALSLYVATARLKSLSVGR